MLGQLRSEHKTTNISQIVASELNDPICHSDECQIGSFSSEATKCTVFVGLQLCFKLSKGLEYAVLSIMKGREWMYQSPRPPHTLYSVESLNTTIFKCETLNQFVNEMKWNESGFRPPLCTYRLNWARRTSWGWWNDWDDTVLQTHDSKFEPWRSHVDGEETILFLSNRRDREPNPGLWRERQRC